MMKCLICGNETKDNICSICQYSLEDDLQLHHLSHRLSKEDIQQYHLQLNQHQQNFLENDNVELMDIGHEFLEDMRYYETDEDYEQLSYYLFIPISSKWEYVLEKSAFHLPRYEDEIRKFFMQRNKVFRLESDYHGVVGGIVAKYSSSALIIDCFYCDCQRHALNMLQQLQNLLSECSDMQKLRIQAICQKQQDIQKYESLGFQVIDRLHGEVLLELKNS